MRKLTRKMRLLHGHEDAETKTASMKIGEDQKFTKCGVPGKLLKERVHKRIRMQIASVPMDCPVDSRYRACMRTVLAMGLDWAVPPRRIAEESLSLHLQRIILGPWNGRLLFGGNIPRTSEVSEI